MSMENQNNQNDKPADGYVQAPQQEAKSVLAELAEFVSRKKWQSRMWLLRLWKQSRMRSRMPEKERNTAGTGNEAGGAPVNDGAKEEKSERPARNNRSRGPRRPRTAAPKRAEGAESSENEKTQEERKPKTPRGTRSTAARSGKNRETGSDRACSPRREGRKTCKCRACRQSRAFGQKRETGKNSQGKECAGRYQLQAEGTHYPVRRSGTDWYEYYRL